MNWLKENFVVLILIVFAIGVGVFLYSAFSKVTAPDEKWYNELLKAKNETIRSEQDHRKTISLQIEEKEQIIDQLMLRDSVLMIQFTANQNNYKNLPKIYESRSAVIDRAGRNTDSIRKLFAN